MKHVRSLGLLLAFITCEATLRAAAAASGHRMLIGDDSKGRIAIVEPDGQISWEEKIGPIHDLNQLSNGNILFEKSWT